MDGLMAKLKRRAPARRAARTRKKNEIHREALTLDAISRDWNTVLTAARNSNQSCHPLDNGKVAEIIRKRGIRKEYAEWKKDYYEPKRPDVQLFSSASAAATRAGIHGTRKFVGWSHRWGWNHHRPMYSGRMINWDELLFGIKRLKGASGKSLAEMIRKTLKEDKELRRGVLIWAFKKLKEGR